VDVLSQKLKSVSLRCVVFLQNQDDLLSRDEFMEGSKCDPWVVQSLNMTLADTRPPPFALTSRPLAMYWSLLPPKQPLT